MKLGKVTGEVAIKHQAACLGEHKILLVELENTQIAALDLAGAHPGDQVLLVLGTSASCCAMDAASDAVITAVV